MCVGQKMVLMTVEAVAVTGGNGKIGKKILDELRERAYTTANLARGKRRENVADEYYTTDLLDAGEVYGSLSRSDVDAVIHMGTIPSPTNHPGYETYKSNVMSSYHVLEAASELELQSVCLASSINAMGCAYQDAPVEVDYLPVDEDHRLAPRDPYAVSKQSIEIAADGFGRQGRMPRTITTLRYPWVATDSELEERFRHSSRDLAGLHDAESYTARDVLFTYLHIEDAANIASDAIEANFTGHERFWAVAADTSAEITSDKLAEEFYPRAKRRGGLEKYESLIDISKAEDVLGWEPERSWRTL
jgi:nucleoside-diphosphate-sugar epimerase